MDSVEDLLERLAFAHQDLGPLIEEKEKELAVIMAPIQLLEDEIKEKVKRQGHSTDTVYAKAAYRKGYTRVSWDGKGLTGFAVAHPEIEAFRRTKDIAPSVSIKIK